METHTPTWPLAATGLPPATPGEVPLELPLDPPAAVGSVSPSVVGAVPGLAVRDPVLPLFAVVVFNTSPTEAHGVLIAISRPTGPTVRLE